MSDRSTEVSPQPASGRGRVWPWVRLVVVLALAFVVCLPVVFFFAWFFFAGGRFGWVPSLLAFGAFGAACGWLAVPGRWQVARRRTAVGLAALLGVAGVAVAHAAPATKGRLRHAINELADPRWHLVSETSSGNAMCFDSCTSLTRQYRATAGATDVAEQLRPALAHHGLRPVRAFDPIRFEFADRTGGDIGTRVSVAPGPGGGAVVYIRAESDA